MRLLSKSTVTILCCFAASIWWFYLQNYSREVRGYSREDCALDLAKIHNDLAHSALTRGDLPGAITNFSKSVAYREVAQTPNMSLADLFFGTVADPAYTATHNSVPDQAAKKGHHLRVALKLTSEAQAAETMAQLTGLPPGITVIKLDVNQPVPNVDLVIAMGTPATQQPSKATVWAYAEPAHTWRWL